MRPLTRDTLSLVDPAVDPTVRQGWRVISSRVRAGLVVLGVLTLVWMAGVAREARHWRLSRLKMPGELRVPESSRGALQAIADLRIAALDRTVPVFEPGRNIFAFASAPEDTHRSKVRDQQQEIARDATPQQATAREPAPDFAVLGVFGPDRLRIAVLEDQGGKSVANIREWDLVEGRYRVLRIDQKSILLRDTASPNSPPILLELP